MADRGHVREAAGRKAPGLKDKSDEEEALEFGRWLFAQDCRFVTGAADLAGLPPAELPEVAFAGRSNVGKSSLVNALTGRKTLARISRSPGRTRQLNFFSLGGRLMLADLPGYGYAKAPKTDVKAWTRLVGAYLRGRPNLRRLCLLVDARLGLKESDRDLMARLDAAAVSYQIILTKADKAAPDELDGRLAALGRELAVHPAAHPEIAVTSARTRLGVAGLRAALAALASDAGRD
jgi:GTP-binding protein